MASRRIVAPAADRPFTGPLHPSKRNIMLGRRTLVALQALAAVTLMSAVAAPGRAQQSTGTAGTAGTVRGVVRHAASGTPLANVQVVVAGTRIGAATKEDGSFVILNVPAGAQRVQARLLGYAPTEKPVTVTTGGTSTVDFSLSPATMALEEVVITGTAGSARKREVGNSISQLKIADAPEAPTNVSNLLQGRVAGASVQLSTGSAGSGSSIRLRGNSSVALSNQPLIYIDGVRMRSDEYPKNVPPTSGSSLRGPNYNASPLNDINPEDIDRIEIIKGAAATTLYGTEAASGVIQIFTKHGTAGKPVWSFETTQGFNRLRPFGIDDGLECSATSGCGKFIYINPWLRDGRRQGYLGSVSGGQNNVRYFVSAGYDGNQGVLPKDDERKVVVRGNFSFEPTQKLTFEWNTAYTSDSISNTPSGNNAAGLTLNAYRRDRNYFSSANIDTISQVLKYDLNTQISHMLLGGKVSYATTANLTHRVTIGLDRSELENRNLRPFGFVSQPTGALSDQHWSSQVLSAEYVGNYEREFSGLRSSFAWGGQTNTSDIRDLQGYTEGFPGPGTPVVSSGALWNASEQRIRIVTGGLFVQEMVGWRDRLFVTVGVRADKYSAFGSNLGLQKYPKISASYVISDESFWPKGAGSLKLRTAYGEAGRAPGAFDALRTYTPVGWGGQPAFRTNTVGNPDLGPERSRETEFGFDAVTLGDRLSLNATFYRTTTSDALLPVTQPPSLGFLGSQLKNVGTLKKHGLELEAFGDVFRSAPLTWNAGLTVALSKSEVVSLGGAPAFVVGRFGWIREGGPVAELRGRYVVNPDEVGTPIIETDHVYGPSQPTRIIGLNSSLRFPHGIELSVRGEYQGGHYINEDASYEALSRGVQWPTCFGAYAKTDATQWTAWERSYCVAANSREDLFIFKADFVKLRDITLRAPIPTRFLAGAAQSGQLSLSVQNWYSWKNKDFRVLDPEMAGNDGFNAAVRYISEHIPAPATVLAQLRLTF
jgi:TonB-dependent SusC/RagA subfamily outer membrane receptor